jgi:hypothetical protein
MILRHETSPESEVTPLENGVILSGFQEMSSDFFREAGSFAPHHPSLRICVKRYC